MAELLGRCKDCKQHCKKCDDIAKEYVRKHINNFKMVNTSLCWCCAKAIPKKNSRGEIEGCSWSVYNRPVPGWDADEGKFKHEYGGDVVTYMVHDCPEFERG